MSLSVQGMKGISDQEGLLRYFDYFRQFVKIKGMPAELSVKNRMLQALER